MAAPTLYAVWYARPASLTLIEKDAAGQEIASRELTPASLYESYSLTPGCVQAELKAGAEGYSLSTLRVFDGPIDESLPCYDPAAPAEGDVLLICGEPHSMLEDFGALLPYCTEGLDLSVSVVFAIWAPGRSFTKPSTPCGRWGCIPPRWWAPLPTMI